MNKILLLGASSNIGFSFFSNYSKHYEIIPVNRSKLNIEGRDFIKSKYTIGEMVELIKKYKPNFIINCVAIGNVDICEENKISANNINYQFVVNLVNLLIEEPKIKLIHFSSNAIYDGLKPPYSEKSIPNPINFYGLTKMKADNYIKDNLDGTNYSILRPISIYGKIKDFQRNNPVNWAINKIKKEKKVELVNDIYSNMIYIDDVAKSIHNLIKHSQFGEFNLSSNKILSLFQIGVKICEILNIDEKKIVGINSTQLNKRNMAPRPKNTSFDNSKAVEKLGIKFIEVEEGIKNIIN